MEAEVRRELLASSPKAKRERENKDFTQSGNGNSDSNSSNTWSYSSDEHSERSVSNAEAGSETDSIF